MPELPEVETIRRGLAEHLPGRTIVSFEGAGGRLPRNNPGGLAGLRDGLVGAQIRSVQRRGKFIWLVLEGGPADSLVVHLGMTGQVRTATRPRKELGRHEHVRLRLDDGRAVRFVDSRMFGHLTLSELREDATGRVVPALAAHIAPDLIELTTQRELTTLAETMRRRRRAVKSLLLDQGLTSGIGNIYADEGLHRAGIHGATRGAELPAGEIRELLSKTRDVMGRAVKAGGTSFDATYVDVDGNPGAFERELRVYGKRGRPCRECSTPIVREVVGGRSHFHCPACQVRPET